MARAGTLDTLQPDGLGMSHGDCIGGIAAAQALLVALHHRERTGRGQTVEIAQIEALIATLGPALLDYTANGRVPRPAGNRLMERPDAPQGVYRCRVPASRAQPDAEESTEWEAWIAVAVTPDAEWAGLRRALGKPTWMADPSLATADRWLAAAERIDRELNAWTSGQEPFVAMARLQAQGVPAGVVENGRDLLEHDWASRWPDRTGGVRIRR